MEESDIKALQRENAELRERNLKLQDDISKMEGVSMEFVESKRMVETLKASLQLETERRIAAESMLKKYVMAYEPIATFKIPKDANAETCGKIVYDAVMSSLHIFAESVNNGT